MFPRLYTQRCCFVCLVAARLCGYLRLGGRGGVLTRSSAGHRTLRHLFERSSINGRGSNSSSLSSFLERNLPSPPLYTLYTLITNTCNFMFARLNQVARHLSRPLPNYAHSSAAAPSLRGLANSFIMASTGGATATERNKRMIHTAGCLIIGDEVLGGKVGSAAFQLVLQDYEVG